eukprot:1968706-Amphidinium_carterae.1
MSPATTTNSFRSFSPSHLPSRCNDPRLIAQDGSVVCGWPLNTQPTICHKAGFAMFDRSCLEST